MQNKGSENSQSANGQEHNVALELFMKQIGHPPLPVSEEEDGWDGSY